MPRYADTPTVEVETEVDAPPSALWPLVTDIDLPARFSTEFRGADWEDTAGPTLGARFRGRSEHPATGGWETTCTVVSFEPERSFGWVVGDPELPSAEWRFELEPTADDSRTTLRQWARLGPGPSGLTPAIEARPDKEERIVERRLEEWRTNMRATVEGIKALAEEGERP